MMRSFPSFLIGFLLSTLPVRAQTPYEIAVYYFPSYHPDAAYDQWHGRGWTEWDLVKAARPRLPGHQQPKVPQLGYYDESDPKWAAKEIDLAADHGIDCFIYDWYWYDKVKGRKFLHGGLENGFLKAPNRNRLKFALMWANHDWANIHPTPYTNHQELLTDGEVSAETFDTLTTYIVETYFKQPNYWKIDNKPFFSIFLTSELVKGLGSIEKTAQALARFDQKTRQAGFAGLHLNLIDQGFMGDFTNFRSEQGTAMNPKTVLTATRASSVGTYNFLYPYRLTAKNFPVANYQNAIHDNEAYWNRSLTTYPVPYMPNVTMGWDVTPRLVQTEKFDQFKGYPWTGIFNGDNTPAAFKNALLRAKAFVDKTNPAHKIITINAWNEWTEGSYLLPDTRTGTAYLEAIRTVFGGK